MEHIAVKIANIPPDLNLNCKIYVKKGEDISFLCENVIVTPALLETFKTKAFPEDSVYITADYMRSFYDRGIDLGWTPPPPPPLEFEVLEIKPKSKPVVISEPEPEPKPPQQKPPPEPKPKPKGEPKTEFERVQQIYETAKEETRQFFADIAEADVISKDKTDEFVQEIKLKLETTDVTLILQSINGIRSVDEYLHTHSLNVAFLNGLMAKWLKFDKIKHDELVKVGLLHDIGKLKVPPEILNKPARLTKEEFAEIKKHPYHSFDMMVKSGYKEKNVLLGILQHHEKLNGTGYPCAISSVEITEFARITSIADIYDAMVARRVYKEAHSPFEILENFSKEGYSQLDINYVKLFIDCMAEELRGKTVVLSDGSIAVVKMVNVRNLMYPMVEVGGEIITTSPELHCVSMFNTNVSEAEVQNV